MSKCLLLPDIHGRKFWKKPCENIDIYDKVIFLGDYFDPYGFENITFEDCVNNFIEIIELKEKYSDKVVLLLGNHDLPYFSEDYYKFSLWHCRHSSKYHKRISELFAEYRDYFKIAYVEDSVLFTHAGVESRWLENVVKCNETDINEICNVLNSLTDNTEGLCRLYSISFQRGGRDKYPSCIWADVHDILWDVDSVKDNVTAIKNPIYNIKQVFGHTIQAFYDENGKVAFGDAIEFENCKMIDTAKPYKLDTKNFTITTI